jgi:hypothetical protein
MKEDVRLYDLDGFGDVVRDIITWKGLRMELFERTEW